MKKILLLSALLAACFFASQLPIGSSSIYLQSLIFLLSLSALVLSADKFTEFAVFIGEALGLSKLATGVLIIAIGTSSPELFASIGAVINGQPSMVIGNVYGTVVANSLLGIGCAALYSSKALEVHKEVFGTQMSILLGSILISVGALYDGKLDWIEGSILIAILIAYLIHTMITEKGTPSNNDTSNEKTSLIWPICFLLVTLLALFISGDFVVSSLIESSKILDFSGDKLATSILAVGTSIPEIATGIALVKKGHADSLFGEIIGSNIFDILGIFGVLSIITELTMDPSILGFLSISIIATYFVLNTIMNDKSINRIEGFTLLSIFSIFTIQLMKI